MVKVKFTRSCLVGGKHYEADSSAEVSEADAIILFGMEKAVAFSGAKPKAAPKKKAKK